MIVIGADVHKSTHALAAVEATTGQLLGEREIAAREQGHLEALRWAHELAGHQWSSTRSHALLDLSRGRVRDTISIHAESIQVRIAGKDGPGGLRSLDGPPNLGKEMMMDCRSGRATRRTFGRSHHGAGEHYLACGLSTVMLIKVTSSGRVAPEPLSSVPESHWPRRQLRNMLASASLKAVAVGMIAFVMSLTLLAAAAFGDESTKITCNQDNGTVAGTETPPMLTYPNQQGQEGITGSVSDFSGSLLYIQAVPAGLGDPPFYRAPLGPFTWAPSGGSYSLCLPPGTYDIAFSSSAYFRGGEDGSGLYPFCSGSVDAFQWYNSDNWDPNAHPPGNCNSYFDEQADIAAYALATPVTVQAGQVVPGIDGSLPEAPPEQQFEPAGSAPVQPPQPPCKAVAIIGARGSGQSGDAGDDRALGPEVNIVATLVEKYLEADHIEARTSPAIYPADDVAGDLIPSKTEMRLFLLMIALSKASDIKHTLDAIYADYYKHNIARFLASIKTGAATIVSDVEDEATACPHEKLILVGYSQGAMAIHQAEVQLAASSPDAAGHIAATVLIADGDRVPESRAALRLGGVHAIDAGIRPYFYRWRHSDVPAPTQPPFPQSTAEICEKGDLVCDFGEICPTLDDVCAVELAKRLRTAKAGVATHTSYPGRFGLLDAAARFAARQAG
jgi:hypothetical protein